MWVPLDDSRCAKCLCKMCPFARTMLERVSMNVSSCSTQALAPTRVGFRGKLWHRAGLSGSIQHMWRVVIINKCHTRMKVLRPFKTRICVCVHNKNSSKQRVIFQITETYLTWAWFVNVVLYFVPCVDCALLCPRTLCFWQSRGPHRFWWILAVRAAGTLGSISVTEQ